MTRKLLDIAIHLSRKAASRVTGKIVSEVATDLERDVKIVDDHLLHQFLSESLTKESGLAVLSEESPIQVDTSEPYWVLDPIDGSVNFSRGIPLSCISIGLWQNQTPMAGVIYDFHRNELFSGIVGVGAWLNNQPIEVSNTSQKEKAICMTGFPVASSFASEALADFILQVQQFKKVRLLGSAALSLAYVASGRADFYIEKSIALWDVAAGLALVSAAGGQIGYKSTLKTLRLDVTASNGRINP